MGHELQRYDWSPESIPVKNPFPSPPIFLTFDIASPGDVKDFVNEIKQEDARSELPKRNLTKTADRRPGTGCSYSFEFVSSRTRDLGSIVEQQVIFSRNALDVGWCGWDTWCTKYATTWGKWISASSWPKQTSHQYFLMILKSQPRGLATGFSAILQSPVYWHRQCKQNSDPKGDDKNSNSGIIL